MPGEEFYGDMVTMCVLSGRPCVWLVGLHCWDLLSFVCQWAAEKFQI